MFLGYEPFFLTAPDLTSETHVKLQDWSFVCLFYSFRLFSYSEMFLPQCLCQNPNSSFRVWLRGHTPCSLLPCPPTSIPTSPSLSPRTFWYQDHGSDFLLPCSKINLNSFSKSRSFRTRMFYFPFLKNVT